MKRFFLMLLTVVAFMGTVAAQPPQRGGKGGADARNSFQAFQMSQIEEALNLEDDRLTKFRDLYTRYNQESRPKHGEGSAQRHNGVERPAIGATSPQMSEEEIEANIKESFKRTRLSLEIKERYYLLFREFLAPSEINTIYEIERRSRERFVDELQHRSGGKR